MRARTAAVDFILFFLLKRVTALKVLLLLKFLAIFILEINLNSKKFYLIKYLYS